MSVTFTPSEVAAFYSARLPKLSQNGPEWRGPCPIHGGRNFSFAVNPQDGRHFCHSDCGKGGDVIALEMLLSNVDFKTAKAQVFRLVGRVERDHHNGNRTNGNTASVAPTKPTGTVGTRREIARYQYVDRDGKLLYEVVRYRQPSGQKEFRQCRPDGHGGTSWDLNGVERVPYHLPSLLRADAAANVYLVEGEKDCHALEQWGLTSTCNPGGTGGSHLYGGWLEYFKGKRIVIVPDNDGPGRKHAVAVAAALLPAAATIHIAELPNLPEKGDVSDWRDRGGTLEAFLDLVEAAPTIDAAGLAELRARWGLIQHEPHHAAARDVVDTWPKLESIQSELPPVQTFCEDLLPEAFRPLVADVAERTQTPMDFPAVVAVLCLAGAVNRRATIQPKANDTGWTIVPNLWGGIIAKPGFMKSPIISAVTRPLNQIQAEWRDEHEAGMAEYEREKEKGEIRRAAWKEQYKSASKKGGAVPDRPEDEPEEPRLRRLIMNDGTFEATHQIMSDNPAGILVIRDELTGWWSQLDRAGREGERAFSLQSWNGDCPFTIDRIGRGTIQVEACCTSMLGGIQPGRLRSYLGDALADGPSNDGLIQRFQLLVWPDTAADWQYVDRAPDAASEQQAARIFTNLVEMDAQKPARFRFAPDAQALFIAWLTELESKVRGNELHPALISHLSKYRSLMPSLALLFELADRGGSVGFDGATLANSENIVSLQHTRQAAAWCEYLESHARRVYSCVVTPQLRAARELADKIKARAIGASGFFSVRNVYLKGWSGLDSPEAVKQAAEVLQDAGWVREQSGESKPSGGRPANRYEVNPGVWE